MKFLDLRDSLCEELIVLCQLANIERVNLSLLFDLVLKARLLEVLVKCLGQSSLTLSNHPVSEEEGFLERKESLLTCQNLDSLVLDLACNFDRGLDRV